MCFSQSSKPHVIFILSDDLGWNDVGYHNSEIKTPTIDRLAKEGVRLENYYVQSKCTPSRASFMTGLYQVSITESYCNCRLNSKILALSMFQWSPFSNIFL